MPRPEENIIREFLQNQFRRGYLRPEVSEDGEELRLDINFMICSLRDRKDVKSYIGPIRRGIERGNSDFLLVAHTRYHLVTVEEIIEELRSGNGIVEIDRWIIPESQTAKQLTGLFFLHKIVGSVN